MAAAALGVLSLAAAALTWPEGSQAGGRDRSGSASVVTAVPASSPAGGARAAPHPPSASAGIPGAGVPTRVVIEALGVDAPVLPVAMQGRSLDPPPDPQDLGWWAAGARPGDARGSALVAGHTVHDGGGALDDLEEIAPGTEIRVRTSGGTVRYVADRVAVLDKQDVARSAAQLFSQETGGRLVLVTCEGWDGTGYRSNVVVVATPVA